VSATRIFLLALVAAFMLFAAWWFMPPAIRADLSQKFQPQSEQSAKAQAAHTGNAPVQTTVYQWKDAAGQQHFSNTPPKNQKYDVIHYRNDANVMDSN